MRTIKLYKLRTPAILATVSRYNGYIYDVYMKNKCT